MNNKAIIYSGIFLAFVFILGINHTALAAASGDRGVGYDYLLKGYNDSYYDYDEGPGASKLNDDPNKAPSRYIYETPTVKALSHLYWGINLYKTEDDDAVDEFMRINECEIYKSFSSDELEWKEIRDATREFLRENKEDFPTRFEFVMPLKLGDYIEKRGAFEIQDEYKIHSLRRFELVASDYRLAGPCTRDHFIPRGYPRAMVLEFSRPFNLVYVPVAKQNALEYIKRRLDYMKTTYEPRAHSKALMFNLRTAYLVIKVKIFTYGKSLGLNNMELPMHQMMGVLEGYEIYEDLNRENLFYAQNYVTNQSKGRLDVRLKPQYEILRKKSKEGKGILH
ncbi:MAG: DUF4852 domain-containing protein [Alcanivorax sp.]